MKSAELIFYFFVLLLIIFGIGEATINYGSLIESVYDKYLTNSIILVPTKNYISFEKIPILQKICRDFSARGILSVVGNFMELKEGMKFHSRKFHRPLVVILIDEITEVHKFSQEMRNIDRRYHLELILFTGDSNEDHCKYCRESFGNPFSLKFNSELLVLCCGSDCIEKWWSERENQTSKLPTGKWNEGKNKLYWYPNNTLYKQRQSMHNKGLRVVIVKKSPHVWKKNDQLHGYLGEVLLELSRYMEFSILHIIEEDTYGYWDSESSMWTGAIGTVVQGNADMGITAFAMTAQRVSAFDFTIPVVSAQQALFIKKSDTTDILWNACFKPLHAKVWMFITIFLLITPLILTVIKYKRQYNLFDMILEHYLNVWGIFCQRSLPGNQIQFPFFIRVWLLTDFPDGAPLRIVYISTYIMGAVLYAAFSASFISSLSTTTLNVPFHTLEEFINDGTYKLIMTNDNPEYERLKTSNDTVSEKMLTMLESRDSWPDSRDEGFEQICTQKKAFYDWKLTYQNRYPCEIVTITIGEIIHFGMILPLRSEYTRIMNHYLQQLEYNGMLRRLKHKYFPTRILALDFPYEPVTFRRVIPILIAFAIGFSIAFIIFCMEIP